MITDPEKAAPSSSIGISESKIPRRIFADTIRVRRGKFFAHRPLSEPTCRIRFHVLLLSEGFLGSEGDRRSADSLLTVRQTRIAMHLREVLLLLPVTT